MIVNGKKRDFPPGITINEIIDILGVHKSYTIVSVNDKLISRDKYNLKLNSDSNVKVRTIVGGG